MKLSLGLVLLFCCGALAQQSGGRGVPGAATNGSLPTAPAAGYAPVSTAAGATYTAQAVPTLSYAAARQTYVLEDFLSTADGHSGTDYGYAATNFCATIGCSTLLTPVMVKTTHPGTCAVYTTLAFTGPVQLDASSCVFIPQSSMGSSYVTLTGCSTTMGSSTVTCASTSGLSAGMAIGGDITIGPENYIASVTNGTTFVLALPASRTFLAIPTISSTTLNGIDDVVDLAAGQSVTGTGVPSSTTIASVNAGANTVTLSNAETVGTLSPVDISLASGTVVSGLTLNAITQTPVISFTTCTGPCQSKAYANGSYGTSLTNVTIRDPLYAAGNSGRSVHGIQGVQIYGEDNVNITNLQVSGIAGSALIWGGYVPASAPQGGQAVRESWVHGLYAYQTGDILTGQACFAIMTGYGTGNTNFDEINTNGVQDMHCVYSDAEILVIGTYLHPGGTNGPRLLTFDGENQAETGGSRLWGFSSTDVVRILTGANSIHFNGGEFSTPGFGKATFHLSNAAGIEVNGADIAADGGEAETYNVGLTNGSTQVTFVSAGTNAASTFWPASHWNNMGVQINDGGTCNPCYMYLANPAVNGALTTATLASPYTGTATSGTMTVAPGGYYFHVENTGTTVLKAIGGIDTPSIAAIRTLLGLSSDAAAWTVGSGALGGIQNEVTDFSTAVNGINQGWNVSNLIVLPSNSITPGNSGSQIFQTTYQNGSSQYVPGGVRVYGTANSGTTGVTYLNQNLLAGGGDFISAVNSSTGSGNAYHQVTATSTANAAYRVFNGSANWQWGLTNGAVTTWYLNDAYSNNAHAMSFTQGSTPNATLYGNLTVNGSSTFTGTATAPTQSTGDISTDVATDAFVANTVALGNLNLNGGTATGSVNALAITLPSSLGSPTLAQLTNTILCFLPNLANTSSTPTLQVNSTAATTIVKYLAGFSSALTAGDIAVGNPACVIYNGTSFVLQNPQVYIIGNSTGTLNATGVRGGSTTAAATYQSGTDGASTSAVGAATFRGGNNSSSGASGNALLEPGANSGSGTQGFATVLQSYTVASALSQTYELVSMTTTADRVQAAPLGSINNVGVAQTVGGSGTQLYVASSGKSEVRFDNTPVVGDMACYPPTSTGTAGLAHDNGTSACPAGQALGPITGQVSGATATVQIGGSY